MIPGIEQFHFCEHTTFSQYNLDKQFFNYKTFCILQYYLLLLVRGFDCLHYNFFFKKKLGLYVIHRLKIKHKVLILLNKLIYLRFFNTFCVVLSLPMSKK